jgi:hypothetical protein
VLGPKHARREDRCPLYRVLRKITSDRSEIGLGWALSMLDQRDIAAFLSFGPEGCHFEGFRGGMKHVFHLFTSDRPEFLLGGALSI